MLNRYNLTFIIFTFIAFLTAKLLHNDFLFLESIVILIVYLIATIIISKYYNNYSNKIPLYLLSIIGLMLISITIYNQYRVIEIDSKSDFLKIYNNLDGNYVIKSDISLRDLNQYDWNELSNENAGECFSGTLEGNDHTINDLTEPLFNCVGGYNGEGTIKNINIISNYNIHTPFVFGFKNKGTITNISLNLNLLSNDQYNKFAGSIVGVNDYGGFIENINFDGIVKSDRYVGGVAGQNLGTIKNISIDGYLSGYDVGGVVGINLGHIINSEVNAELSGITYAAGVAVENFKTIENCYIGAKFSRGNNFNYGISYNESGHIAIENCIVNIDNLNNLSEDDIYLIGNATNNKFKNILIYTEGYNGSFNLFSKNYTPTIENIYHSNSLNILDGYGVSVDNDILSRDWYKSNLNLTDDNWNFNDILPKINIK